MSNGSSVSRRSLLAFPFAGRRYESVEPHMGTLMRITLYSGSRGQAKRAFTSAFARIAQLNQLFSDYIESSELNRLCRGAWREPMKVSPDLYTILTIAQRIARETGGAFDVTAGPLIRQWRHATQMPVPQLDNCGYKKVELRDGMVFLKRRGMQLDLGGIGKGYAAQQALLAIHKQGVRDALVAASGDVVFSGKRHWQVQAGGDKLSLRNAAVSTSGDREQFTEIGGVRYSHIVDPRNGVALTQRFETTVIGNDGALTDAAATTVCVLGKEEGARWARSRGLAVRIRPSESGSG